MLGRLYYLAGGAKTIVTCTAVFLLGAADLADAIDIRGLLEHYVGSDKAGTIMMFLGLLFGVLRYYFTSGPAWGRGGSADGHDYDDGVDRRAYARVDDPGYYDVDRSRRRAGRGRTY